MLRNVIIAASIILSACVPLSAADEIPPQAPDGAQLAYEDLRAGGDSNKRYFLFGPERGAVTPEEGYGLITAIPGGNGSAQFFWFGKGIYADALNKEYLVAQLVAVKWTPGQYATWPTLKNPAPEQKFSTEEFVEAVVKDVKQKHRLNDRCIFTVSFSAGGYAGYAVSLQEKKSTTGSFIGMAAFDPRYYAPLALAKGHAYFLYHSPDDKVFPFRMAKHARDALTKNGAKVKLVTYRGTHYHSPTFFKDIRQGIRWLEERCR